MNNTDTLTPVKTFKPMARKVSLDRKGDRWAQCPRCGVQLNLRFAENTRHAFYGC